MPHFPHDSDVESSAGAGWQAGPSPAAVTQVFALAEPCARLMDLYRLSSFEYAYGSFRLCLKKGDLPVAPAGLAPAAVAPDTMMRAWDGRWSNEAARPASGSSASVAETAAAPGGKPVNAPMVGTFYAAPKPGDPPFVTLGSVVKEGQTLCIIEAMKTMNAIKAPVAGRIHRLLLEDGQPVEFGQLLMEIMPEA